MKTEHNGNDEHVEEDFVYNESNKHLSKKFLVLEDAITKEEAQVLEKFIFSKLPVETEDEQAQVCVLPYRTDEWDELGVIHKVQGIAKQCIEDVYHPEGAVEPKKFELVRTDSIQKYERLYPRSYINRNEILYTIVVTPTRSSSYDWGQTVYLNNGEGFKPAATNVLIHRNEEYNNWSVEEPMNGTRLDLIITLREMNMGISYDYSIEQSPGTVEDY